MKDIDELEMLVPEEVFVTINSEQIEIKPFKFLNLLKVLKILFKMLEGIGLEELDQFSLVKLLVDNPEEMLRIFSIATGKQAGYFETIDAAEGIDLVTTIYKVNEDFFVRQLKPKLEKLNVLSSSPKSQMMPEQLQQNEEEQESLPKEELETETTKTEQIEVQNLAVGLS